MSNEFTPYTVQRILRMRLESKAPQGNLVGYYRNGTPKLSDEERQTLRGILPLDYMGKAEFEFGAVPEALVAMARRDNLVTDSMILKGKPYDICIDSDVLAAIPEREATLHLLVAREWVEPLKEYLRQMVLNRFAYRHEEIPQYSEGLFGRIQHKRGARNRRLKAIEHEDGRISMWLDLGLHWAASTNPLQLQYLKVMLGRADS